MIKENLAFLPSEGLPKEAGRGGEIVWGEYSELIFFLEQVEWFDQIQQSKRLFKQNSQL